ADNARYYKNSLISKYIAANQRVEIIFLPPYSPNLNMKNLSFVTFVILLFCFSCQTDKEGNDNTKPAENRFTTTSLNDPGSLDEPMAFTFLDNEEMLLVERKGGVKAFNVESSEMRTVGFVPVNTKYINKEGQSREAEEGLMGIIAHPDYAKNNWIFMLYADPDEPKHVLARWDYRDDSLFQSSKKIVLEYRTQREECCHTGGGMIFDKDGNLFLTTGNNTVNPPQGTSNLDERPGFETSDDQRTGGNTNDLRGKIIRIHPEDDGSYTIPKGNLFREDNAKARSEIYTMGHRNPWRISIDSETGFIYWGEVGPDAAQDSEAGPRGYDEFNQAKGPGFFGWPYFIGDNQPYIDYDFATETYDQPFDVNGPMNNSPNNTGLTELPLPEKAFIWYPYAYSEEFPLLGSAGRNATGGPVFRKTDFSASDKRFPGYYEGKWLIVDFMRGWIMSVTMDENSDYVSMEPFLPEEYFLSAIDIKFSPDGDLYVLEYGSAWFRANNNSFIKQVRYNGGNRIPVVKASASKMAGAIPMSVQLSSDGTLDYDDDKLTYEWTITSGSNFQTTLRNANPSLTLEEEGVYKVQLVVTDSKGNTNDQVFEIMAGNEPPEVDIQITSGNQSFYFPGNELGYAINVIDKEDGTLDEGSIDNNELAINFDYAPEGFDPIEIAQNHRSSDKWIIFSKGKKLIDGSDCLSCHRIGAKSIGPSYKVVAETYKNDLSMRSVLADRIINGSVGIWGEHAMSAHPDFSKADADAMVEYIMGLNHPQDAPQMIPTSGTYTTEAPDGTAGKGGYLLRVAYTDKGTATLGALTSEKIVALRNPVLNAEHYDSAKGTQLLTTPNRSFNIIENDAYLSYSNIDLTGIKEILIRAEASSRVDALGAVIEVRLNTPEGMLVGATEKIMPIEIDFRGELQKLRVAWDDGGKVGPRPGFGMVRVLFSPKYIVPVSDIEGVGDLFLVFKNGAAKKGQILLQMNEIEFRK
ncbi:MAG: cytochrome c, partial [Saprospiraceae bacterium]